MKSYSKMMLLAIALIAIGFSGNSQESFYDFERSKQLTTTDAKAPLRPGSCWANAGVSLLEAEMLGSGKTAVDLSELAFIRNAYLLKANAHLASKGEIRVDERGVAFDVVTLMAEYGLTPEDAFIRSDEQPMDARSGEMDAILRGTLQMVMRHEDGVFTDRWQSTYDAALTRHIGFSRQNFEVDNNSFNSKTFANASGLRPSDFIMLAADANQQKHQQIGLPARNNWNNYQAFNLDFSQLPEVLITAVNNGHAVIWYGSLPSEMIYEDERAAIVPLGKIADLTKTGDGVEANFEPLPEKEITSEDRQAAMDKNINAQLDYLLITGISKDKNGAEYLVGKKVCQSGNQTLHLSATFIRLNTMYLMLNKQGLSSNLRAQLKL